MKQISSRHCIRQGIRLALAAGCSAVISTSVIAKSDFGLSEGYYTARDNYIIRLADPAVASYKGGMNGLVATAVDSNFQKSDATGRMKLNLKSSASQQYIQYLKQQQTHFIQQAESKLGEKLNVVAQFQVVLDGLNVEMTPWQAEQLKQMPGVLSVIRTPVRKPHTDRGPLLINAPAAWNGTATGVSAKGEGIVVGIIDTGIRPDHPAFAAVDPVDGYVHINPLGSGSYLGYCATNANYCNDKLIGAWNFASGVNDPTDENEHGTHVASTAAGNNINFDLGGGNSLELHGVAPRANIIAYRIADSGGTSSGGASTQAIEQAVKDGVDVINYSFGGDAFNPWSDADAVAYRNARAAGVIVVTSAGNSGPDAGTVGSPADAPWLTSVAASTHDRGDFPTKSLNNMSGGDTTPPAAISGHSLSGEITAPIVYAGNYSNGDTNPEQCLHPFPANTFNGEIVVCDRGEIARVEKAKNVAAGGAGGYVLANMQGGASFLADDLYVIPGIHINADDGDTLKAWLASGSGHTATITGTNGPVGVNTAAADIIAGFSSRGENTTAPDIVKPSVAAPGVSILAAGLAPVDYAFLQGTSMASPHVAGAAALVKQLRPSWTPGQIHSALMTTAVTTLKKENKTDAADPFDMGGGRIDIAAAVNAGLLMDETEANFIAANPSSGGRPKTLNLPGLADSECWLNCSWQRTVTAAVDGSWTASYVTDSGLTLAVTPASFSLSAGQTQALDISADITGDDGQWLFGRVILTPADTAVSATHLTVAAKVNNSTMPESLVVNSKRDAGQRTISGVTSIASASLAATVYLTEAPVQSKSLAKDSTNDSPYDDLNDGVSYELITINSGDRLLFAETFNSTATDLDLYIGRDLNSNGRPDEFEELAKSTSSDANEEILLKNPTPATYWVLVQNWDGAATGTDSYDYVAGKLTNTASSNMTATVGSASSDGSTPFNIDLDFTQLDNPAAKYYGVLTLGSSQGAEDLGKTNFTMTRDSDDVSLSASPTTVAAGEKVTVTISISPDGSAAQDYSVSMDIPTGLTLDSASLSNGAVLNGSTISWDQTVNGTNVSTSFDLTPAESLAGQTVTLTAEHTVNLPGAVSETATSSFAVSSASSGGGGTGGGTGGNTGGSSGGGGGGGGGSLAWWIMLLPAALFSRRRQ